MKGSIKTHDFDICRIAAMPASVKQPKEEIMVLSEIFKLGYCSVLISCIELENKQSE
jgi:hypothetical protein